jgi:HAD superfamily hydrolase (TIGR01509 family)
MSRIGSLVVPESGFKGVIFDCDGTLVDSMPMHFEAWCEALARFGAANIFKEDVFYAMGGRPTKDIVVELNAEYGLRLDPLAVAMAKRDAFLRGLKRVEIIEEVVDYARSLRGKMPMAVATGGTRLVIEKTLLHAGISELFDEVITADEVPIGKPSPAVYFEAALRLGIAPELCLAFEDAPAGILSAQAAGMQVVVVPSPLEFAKA